MVLKAEQGKTMKALINRLLEKTPLVRDLEAQVQKQGLFPAGHYYSPIPTRDEVRAYVDSRPPPGSRVPGIDLNEEAQLELLSEFFPLYSNLRFPETPSESHRFFYQNDWFSYSDAIFLFCFLQRFEPKRIVEVGSGFSSAAILDTIEATPGLDPEISCIEPDPDRLFTLLRGEDKDRIEVIERRVQDVPLDLLTRLEAGDLLFIDSSHVVKCGSDLQFLLFEVAPHLKPGVFVHFHDVFYPFDYPPHWLSEGRYWNENYFLRAFLSYNSEWTIRFFNTYVHHMYGELISEKMPLCAKNPGGSLYIQRRH